MSKFETFNIDKAAADGMTSEEIELFLNKNNNGFIFQKIIERARHYSDLAIYYLEASYVCEKVASLGKWEAFKVDWESGYHPVAQFIFIPDKPDKLSNVICELVLALAGEYGEDEFWWMETLEEYKNNIQMQKLEFPELADDYFANLINGAYGEYESNYDDPEDFHNSLLKQAPEHIFGFWKCMYSNVIQQQFYVSSESWIIPPQSDFNEILKKYSSINDFSFNVGSLFSLNGRYYVISDNYILSLSFPALAKAVQCISQVFNEETLFSDRHNWLDQFNLTYEVSISDLQILYNSQLGTIRLFYGININ